MKLHLAIDSFLELAGLVLLVIGIYVLAGLGAAFIAAALGLILLAEFTFSGSILTIPLSRRQNSQPSEGGFWKNHKAKREQKKIAKQLLTHNADLEKQMNDVFSEYLAQPNIEHTQGEFTLHEKDLYKARIVNGAVITDEEGNAY